jgi:hypothetical protein
MNLVLCCDSNGRTVLFTHDDSTEEERSPTCKVEIIDPVACLCNEDEKKYTFHAKDAPPGGTFSWTLMAANGEAAIVGAANKAEVVVNPD